MHITTSCVAEAPSWEPGNCFKQFLTCWACQWSSGMPQLHDMSISTLAVHCRSQSIIIQCLAKPLTEWGLTDWLGPLFYMIKTWAGPGQQSVQQSVHKINRPTIISQSLIELLTSYFANQLLSWSTFQTKFHIIACPFWGVHVEDSALSLGQHIHKKKQSWSPYAMAWTPLTLTHSTFLGSVISSSLSCNTTTNSLCNQATILENHSTAPSLKMLSSLQQNLNQPSCLCKV